jgi:hypothetical protein
MSEIYHSICPIVLVETRRLYAYADMANLPRKWFDFEATLVWLRESETTVRLKFNGHLLSTLATYTDYYGFMASAEAGIERAKQYADNLGIMPQDRLIAECLTTIFDIPVSIDGSREAVELNRQFPRKRFIYASPEWFISDQPADPNNEHSQPRLKSKVLVEDHVSFTTKMEEPWPWIENWKLETKKIAIPFDSITPSATK